MSAIAHLSRLRDLPSILERVTRGGEYIAFGTERYVTLQTEGGGKSMSTKGHATRYGMYERLPLKSLFTLDREKALSKGNWSRTQELA